VESPAHDLGNPRGVHHLLRVLGERREHRHEVHLLEGLAAEGASVDLADQQQQRRRVLEGGVNPDRGVRGARPARDEGDAGPPGELAVGLGHVRRPALLPAYDEPDRVARVAERVERREVALSRNAEDRVDPVDPELVDEDAPAGSHAPNVRGSGSSSRIVARCSFGFSSSAGSE
jgi:hypothetical protein